jgi:hypothetical protein
LVNKTAARPRAVWSVHFNTHQENRGRSVLRQDQQSNPKTPYTLTGRTVLLLRPLPVISRSDNSHGINFRQTRPPAQEGSRSSVHLAWGQQTTKVTDKKKPRTEHSVRGFSFYDLTGVSGPNLRPHLDDLPYTGSGLLRKTVTGRADRASFGESPTQPLGRTA